MAAEVSAQSATVLVTDDVASARPVVDGLAGGLVDSLRPVDDVDMGLAIRGPAHWRAPSVEKPLRAVSVQRMHRASKERRTNPTFRCPYDPICRYANYGLWPSLCASLIALAPDAFHPSGRFCRFFFSGKIGKSGWQN
jgi:hypothetical protein